MPSSLSWKWESCNKASASVRLATCCCWDTVEVGVARLLPPTPLVGGLGCWPRGVHDEPKDEAPEVEDNGEEDPSWMEGEEAELGTVVDDNKEDEVVDKSENKLRFISLHRIWID